MYISCATRPDISFAVNSCASFMQNPGESHLKAAKHILRYLRTTRKAKLTYSKQPVNMANVLYGYVDADHAGSPEAWVAMCYCLTALPYHGLAARLR